MALRIKGTKPEAFHKDDTSQDLQKCTPQNLYKEGHITIDLKHVTIFLGSVALAMWTRPMITQLNSNAA